MKDTDTLWTIKFFSLLSSFYMIELKYIENSGVLTILWSFVHCNVKNIIKISSLEGLVY